MDKFYTTSWSSPADGWSGNIHTYYLIYIVVGISSNFYCLSENFIELYNKKNYYDHDFLRWINDNNLIAHSYCVNNIMKFNWNGSLKNISTTHMDKISKLFNEIWQNAS